MVRVHYTMNMNETKLYYICPVRMKLAFLNHAKIVVAGAVEDVESQNKVKKQRAGV